ncbi:hypothetical protein T439DRAFT_44247 [Meredithblackwellia eburnea MCA 4105]
MTPKPAQCPVCQRVFAKADHLVRHQRRHTGAKPFQCVDCNRSFARKDVLQRHIKAHERQAQAALNRSQGRETLAGDPAAAPPRPSAPTQEDALLVVSAMSLASLESFHPYAPPLELADPPAPPPPIPPRSPSAATPYSHLPLHPAVPLSQPALRLPSLAHHLFRPQEPLFKRSPSTPLSPCCDQDKQDLERSFAYASTSQ